MPNELLVSLLDGDSCTLADKEGRVEDAGSICTALPFDWAWVLE
jgi:hypothetical protein